MPTENNFIVAVELGSSKVTGIAGQKEPDGAVHILAVAQEPSASFIRKGRINNLLKMQSCITRIKDKLEKSLKKSINQTYVGVGGMGMHTIPNTIMRTFAEKTQVDSALLEEVQEENQQAQSGEREILEAVTQEYKLGAQTTLDPVGIPTESFEAHFLNVVTKREVRENITQCFHDAGLDIAGTPITFLTLAKNMLTEQQRLSGCVFVDMGAGTTSVAVFKNNILRHLAVIPLGGENITRDITALQIDETEAERLKISFGRAVTGDDAETQAPIALSIGRTVSFEEFNGLIEARQEEIIANIDQQIKISKYDKSQLIGGIVVTGGASKLRDLAQAFRKYTGFDSVTFVNDVKLQLRTPNTLQNFNQQGAFNSAIALIECGEENCCGGELGKAGNGLFLTKEQTDRINAEKQREAEAAAAAEADRLNAAIKEVQKCRTLGELNEIREQYANFHTNAAFLQAADEVKQRIEEVAQRRARRHALWDRIKKYANDLVSDNPED